MAEQQEECREMSEIVGKGGGFAIDANVGEPMTVMQVRTTQSHILTIKGNKGEDLVTIERDGKIKVADGVCPNDAAKSFVQALSFYMSSLIEDETSVRVEDWKKCWLKSAAVFTGGLDETLQNRRFGYSD